MSRQLTPTPALPPAAQTTDEAALSEAYTPLLRQIAARRDLRVRVAGTTRAVAAIEARNGEPVYAHGAYWQGENLIELETSLLGNDVDISKVNPSRFSDLTRMPQLHGVAVHQAAHAAHTQLDFDALALEDPAVRSAALLLEDVRVEARLLSRRRPDALWLRAAIRTLLRFELLNDGDLLWDAAKSALLTCGRVDAGSLEPADVTSARAASVAVLGEDRFARLQELWQQSSALADGDQESLLALARRWCAVCEVDPGSDPEATATLPGGIPLDAAEGDAGSAFEDHADCASSGSEAQSEDAEGADDSGESDDPGDAGESDDAEGADDSGESEAGSSDARESEGDPGEAAGDGDNAGSGEPAGDGADTDSEELRGALRDALRDAGAASSATAEQELAEQGEIRDEVDASRERVEQARKAEARREATEAKERQAEAEAAEELFSDDDQDADDQDADDHDDDQDEDDPDHSAGAAGHSRAVRGWREPTGAERAAAMQLARTLEQRLWRPPDTFRRTSQLPPGRLHSRGAMAQSVQIALGKPLTARPWRRTVRVPEPPLELVVGLGVDRSGSMSGIIAEACSAAWIVSDAAKRVNATFASVTFGEKTEPLTRPGIIPERVPQLAADAGYETIGSAIATLDGALSLQDSSKVRLLCIVSDGYWGNPTENAEAQRRLTQLHSSGCGLLLCNAGPIADDVPHMEKLVLDNAAAMVSSLAAAVLATLESN